MQAEGVALVTGAGRGLGRSIALDLARAGFEVVATMRDPGRGTDLPELAAAQGGRLRVEQLDVTDDAPPAMPDGLRVLVNNAGAEGEYLPVEHQPLDDYRHMFEVNVIGCVRTIQAAIPVMREGGGGVICNITSSSYLAAQPLYGAYRASKAALGAVGESLRTEVASMGIRVVEVMPGPVDTDMLRGSDRLPEASRFPPYADVAQRTWEGRKAVEGQIASAADAAARVRQAILDDAAPLRNGCDPLGDSLLDAWRSMGDEELMRQFMRGFD